MAENLATSNKYLNKKFSDFVYEADKNSGEVSLLFWKEITLKKIGENKGCMLMLEEKCRKLIK